MENIIRDQGQINWQVISKKLYLLNDDPDKLFRSAKHCKEHWNCFLSPLVKKGNWTQEED